MKTTIDLTQPRRVSPPYFTHPMKNRGFAVKRVDFIAFPTTYIKPEFGSEDEHGILINEGAATDIGAGVIKFTREYVSAVPTTWEEYEVIQFTHDEFISGEVDYRYYKFWSARGESKDPAPPADNLIPEGASLFRTIEIGVASSQVRSFADLNNDGVQDFIGSADSVDDWGGTTYIYRYAVDPRTGQNLIAQQRIAATNFTINPLYPSTCQVPIKTKLTHSYLILPYGPQDSDFIQATEKTKPFGDSILSWPRSTDTVLEPSIFTQISGALYERVVRRYVG